MAEWIQDPYNEAGYTYTGPGFRLPFYIVSPWTRGGNVFTEHADHNSQIMFIEEWLAAKGKDVSTNQMTPWRREHMSSLVNAFDFENPDYSIASIPYAIPPHETGGVYDGSSYCEATYAVVQPKVPYTQQVDPSDVSSYSEQGFKSMRGALTEGRYIVLELNGYALANTGKQALDATKAASMHEDIKQQWVVHAQVTGGDTFTISSAQDAKYIGANNEFIAGANGAEVYTISFKASRGYALQNQNGRYLTVGKRGHVSTRNRAAYFKAYSVT